MKATTHTEVYRRFQGELKKRPLRPLILAFSAIRIGFRRKLPVLLLFAPPAIGCIVVSVGVYIKFNGISGFTGVQDSREMDMVDSMIQQRVDVTDLILQYVEQMRFFALLALSWYGAGLIAEDRRLGANLLYFSRPLSRLEYLAGKFLGAAFWGACAILYPTVIVLMVAAFTSPEWIFLKEEWDVMLNTLLFACLYITTLTMVVLAISSLVERKTLALVGSVGFVFLSFVMGNAIGDITNDDRWRLVDLTTNFSRIGAWMLDRPSPLPWDVEASFWMVGTVLGAATLILLKRLRRMEVVA